MEVDALEVDPMPEGMDGLEDEQALEGRDSGVGSEVPEIEASPEGEVEELAMGEVGDGNPGEELTDEELEALLAKLG